MVRAILGAEEKVKHIEVISGLPYGLSDQAIQAARLIKFKPAKKDGKAVSCWVELEFGFNIY
jgi:periplasmic protein TonB